jgi:lysophospholipase L1-like esterase
VQGVLKAINVNKLAQYLEQATVRPGVSRCVPATLQGVLKAINVNKLTKCGVTFKFWVADWFAQLNNKMGGDLKKIQTVGRYMVEVSRCNMLHLS